MNSQSAPDSETSADHLCVLCRDPIPVDAVKCRICGGFQGRWFFLNMSVPTLGMLVALISVISLCITLLAPLFQPNSSDLRVSFQYFDNGKANFVVSNAGNRPGSIGESWVDFVDPTKTTKPERYFLVENSGNRFVSPGSSRQLTFALPCGESAPSVNYRKSEGFGSHPISSTELVVSVVQFDGITEYVHFPLDDLPTIMTIVDAHHDCVQLKLGNAAKE